MGETLTVWQFVSPTGADTAASTLEDLERQRLIDVHDAAVVSWPEGSDAPTTRRVQTLSEVGLLGGSFWAQFVTTLFLFPVRNALGVGLGAHANPLQHLGIDDQFIADTREKITPGSSALFVLSSDAVLDRVREEFAGQNGELMSTNLTRSQERRLRELFSR
ncbi:DUF1269 domain-containing protein [Rhodococcus triatomae]|uniref:Uncharacterized membrane protein n=1 Tax=Rhodococcus triatomae TaxID=300028 RepID=A0A1G8I7B9_9NOCA|nr:DUF1269 domain-containing protein [Rhodococcus triatomae]QNG20977.1 DUF1269 domain-containing protein [Rhodococcus triatomae]QNG23108.1 DUF1269 domain-containing protein [Rhodococcus triatomae]SDI14813.1 Uncharacterized membrane protein [Rhodococcus triatomae]